MRGMGSIGVIVGGLGLTVSSSAMAATPPLQLPWNFADAETVTNGHNTSSRTGMDAWAWDFGLVVGEVVRSPADGAVRMVKMDSDRGGVPLRRAWGRHRRVDADSRATKTSRSSRWVGLVSCSGVGEYRCAWLSAERLTRDRSMGLRPIA